MINEHFVIECQGRVVTLRDSELKGEYDLYRSLEAKGLRDEVWISIMERELERRELV